MSYNTSQDIPFHNRPLTFIKVSRKKFHEIAEINNSHRKSIILTQMAKKFPDEGNFDQYSFETSIRSGSGSNHRNAQTNAIISTEPIKELSNFCRKSNEEKKRVREKKLSPPPESNLLKDSEEIHKKKLSNPGLIKFLIFNNTANVLVKLKIIFQKIFLSHIFAAVISICKIATQNKISDFCWFELCSCVDIKIKFYSVFSDFFFFWLLYIILAIKSVMTFKEFHEKTWIKFFMFISLSSFIFSYYFITPIEDFNPRDIYIFIIGFSFLFYLVYLCKMKIKFILWMKNCFKVNSLFMMVFVNNYLARYYFVSFFSLINNNMDTFWSKNIVLIIIAIYFKTFVYLVKKMLFIYYKFILTQNKKNSRTLMSQCRYILCFIVCFNISSLLKMEYNDIGGWLLILFYFIFVFSAYINIDYFSIILDKFKSFITKKFKIHFKVDSTEPDLTLTKFERMFSEAMFDMILICSSKLLILYIGKRWNSRYYTTKYYENCSFEMSPKFSMTIIGFLSILIVNLAVTVLVLVYMIKKKKIFFDYKFRNYTFYNTYFLVLLHGFFEEMLQTIYSLTE